MEWNEFDRICPLCAACVAPLAPLAQFCWAAVAQFCRGLGRFSPHTLQGAAFAPLVWTMRECKVDHGREREQSFVVGQFYTTCLNILFVGIRLGWTLKTLNLLGWIPTVRHRFVPPPPHHHHQHIFNISNFQYQKGKHSHQSHQVSIVSLLLCMICPLQIDGDLHN